MFRFAQEKKNDFTKDLPLKERQKLNSLFKSNAFSFRESVFPVGSIIVMPVSGKKYQVQASGEWVRVYDESTPPRNNKKQRRLQKVLGDKALRVGQTGYVSRNVLVLSGYRTRVNDTAGILESPGDPKL